MSKFHRRSRWALALATATAVITVGLAGCSSSTPTEPTDSGDNGSGELTTLKVATIGLLSDGAMQLGIQQGFFEDEGLKIETSLVANPPAGLAAAQGSQVDIAYAPSIPLLNALSQGIKLQVIQAADGYDEGAWENADDPAAIDDSALFAAIDSDITSIEQLEGKTIAIPARKAQLEVTITSALKDAGADPSKVNWVVLDFTSAVAALKSGTVDAAGLVSPFTDQATGEGAKRLASPGLEFFEEGAVGLWVAGEATISSKADAIAAFQRAIAKSNAYANENPEEAVQAGIDYTKSNVTVEDATIPFWPTTVKLEELERVNDKLVDLGFLASPVNLDGVILKAE